MPQINDSSDYTRRLKLAAVSTGNNVATQSKFRALTSKSSYDASIIRNVGGSCNDLCAVTTKHSLSILMKIPYNAALKNRIGAI